MFKYYVKADICKKSCKIKGDQLMEMVEEAITCRTRFADLFMLLVNERSTETLAFIEQYGLYRDIEYKPQPVDIGFLLKDIMKAYH